MERFSIEGKLFHRICFKCDICGVQLKTGTYHYSKKEGRFFCEKHYKDRCKFFCINVEVELCKYKVHFKTKRVSRNGFNEKKKKFEFVCENCQPS